NSGVPALNISGGVPVAVRVDHEPGGTIRAGHGGRVATVRTACLVSEEMGIKRRQGRKRLVACAAMGSAVPALNPRLPALAVRDHGRAHWSSSFSARWIMVPIAAPRTATPTRIQTLTGPRPHRWRGGRLPASRPQPRP